MALDPVELETPESFSSVQVDGTKSQCADFIDVLDTRMGAQGLEYCSLEGTIPPDLPDGITHRWRVRWKPFGIEEQLAEYGNWFVVSSLGNVQAMLDEAYRIRFGLPPADTP